MGGLTGEEVVVVEDCVRGRRIISAELSVRKFVTVSNTVNFCRFLRSC